MNTSPPHRSGEPADEPDAFDTFMTAADAELLEYVRAHADHTGALTTLLAFSRDNPRLPDPVSSTPAVARLTQLIRARLATRDPDSVLGRAIDDARSRAHDLVRDLDSGAALNIALRSSLALRSELRYIRGRARSLDSDLDIAFNIAQGRDLDLAHGIAVEITGLLDLALGTAVNIAYDVDLAFDHAHDPRVRDRVRDLDYALSHARDLVIDLDIRLWQMTIDVSGVDLTALHLGLGTDLDVLAEVVWDTATRWPPEYRDKIMEASQEIRPGIFRVPGEGPKRDPHKGIHM